MDSDMDFTLSGAARAPALASSSSIYRAKEPFHVQVIPPNAHANASPAYVTHLLSLSTSYGTGTLLVIADDSTLTLIDKTSGVVAESHRAFKDARITQAKPLGSTSSPAGSFVASVSDGTVACWDTRVGLIRPVWTLQGTSKAPYLCVEPSPNDANTVVAGTEQYGHGDSDIDIWDVRSAAAPKSKYNEVHSDDITALQYHPDAVNHSGILLSGSTDGLVSAIDTTIAEEDDAVVSVGNTGNSVARAGWIYSSTSSSSTTTRATAAAAMDTTMDRDEAADLGQIEIEARRRALGKVWAVGDMQTVSLFDADKFDPILPTTDVRSSSSLRPPWSTDYVIDAFYSLPSFSNPPTEESLTLFVGKSEGAFATISIPTSSTASAWGLRAVFPEQGDGTFYGHADIIRSVEWDASTNTLYTGGEDGNLCFWNFDPSTNQVAESGSIQLNSIPQSAAMVTDSAASSRSGSRTATPSRSQRYTPYK